MVNDEKYSVFVHSKSYPAVFFTVFLVFNRKHVGVKKNLRSTLETDLMLAEILFRFRWVPFKIVLHDSLTTLESSGMAANAIAHRPRPK